MNRRNLGIAADLATLWLAVIFTAWAFESGPFAP